MKVINKDEMQIKIKKLIIVVMASILVLPNSNIYSIVNNELKNTEYINSQLENSIIAVENCLFEKGTSIEKELENFIIMLKGMSSEISDKEDYEKVQALICSVNNLLTDYNNYKSRNMTMSFHPIYSPAIAAVISVFSSAGYFLAVELLAHAEEITQYHAYNPFFGSRVRSSPVINLIMLSQDTYGSNLFPQSGTTHQIDLYYAIHRFNWFKCDRGLVIVDLYDFAPGDYDGIAGIAINTMWLAQEAGVLTPYLVEIIA